MKTNKQKLRRQKRIRSKITGTKEKPRLSVFRSNQSLYAQLIDDVERKTLLGVSQKHLGKQEKSMTKIAFAKLLGQHVAKEALAKKIKQVIFDKGRYAYHGRVKALAEGAREGGLQF